MSGSWVAHRGLTCVPGCCSPEPDTVELWPDGPVVRVEDLIAEHKRLRKEGRIVDAETVHGTVTMYTNEHFKGALNE